MATSSSRSTGNATAIGSSEQVHRSSLGRTEPHYPRNAEARRLAGWVDVTFSVDPSGQTTNVRVIGAEPPEVFDDAALLAVRRWRFDADESATEPVNSGIRIRFDPK